MEFEHFFSLRLITSVLGLLLLLQLPKIFASELVIQSKVCGDDQIAYSNSHGHELFYINGNLVDKVLFCKALKFYHKNNCIFEGFFESNHCKLGLPLVELPFQGGRKLLQTKEEATMDDFGQKSHPKEDKNDRKSLLTTKKVGLVVPGVFAVCCALLCPCFYRKRKEPAHAVLAKEAVESVSSVEVNPASEKIQASPLRVPPSPRFSMSSKLRRLGSGHLNLSQIAKATSNFSPSLQIGEGGFGIVYKAQLDNGQVVAIKRAKSEHFASLRTEFSSEVELLAKIDHMNLVKLLGYVDKGNERLIITEYVPNGNLREHLDGTLLNFKIGGHSFTDNNIVGNGFGVIVTGQRGKILDFNQRLGITIDIAHALTYLHIYAEKKIIHRDVKSSNILLTDSLKAKVADFGFARLGVESDQTHISTKVKGTFGYLDPDYMKTYQLTPKSDVYSFGILLLEILTGCRPVELKRPVEDRVTLRWAFKNYDEGKVVEIVDPLMDEVVDPGILVKIFGLAFQCAAPIRSERPDMKTVGEQLWAIRADYLRSVRKG